MTQTQRSSETDAAWERIARANPYWGVLSHDEFDAIQPGDARLADFWATGNNHVEHVIGVLRRRLETSYRRTIVVDFGCGVGRLLIPFAQIADEVFGIDSSPTMRELAIRNLRDHECMNAVVASRLDELGHLKGKVDLVHSTLVFQHIRTTAGLDLFGELVSLVAPGGCGAVQFFLGHRAPKWRQVVESARMRHRSLNVLVNLAHGRLSTERLPYEMNAYSLKDLLVVLAEAGITDAWVEGAVRDNAVDAMLYFSKPG